MKKKVISKIKKKVEEFLLEEDGKVSKSSIVKTGIAVAAASTLLATEVSAGWTYTSSLTQDASLCVKHVNHASHASHASY